MPPIPHGTRVHHRRYPWMVGYIVGFDKTDCMGDLVTEVCWRCDGREYVQYEIVADLRMTPVQPSYSRV